MDGGISIPSSFVGTSNLLAGTSALALIDDTAVPQTFEGMAGDLQTDCATVSVTYPGWGVSNLEYFDIGAGIDPALGD